jgi:hypothetical protein
MAYILIARSQRMTEADLHVEAELHTFNTAASSSCDTIPIHDAKIDWRSRSPCPRTGRTERKQVSALDEAKQQLENVTAD